ncbi:MAG: EAL domain-containing protein [Vicinamibacteria bacterium]
MTPGGGRENEYFRLRAEWLRFKGHLIDADTELPTLAAVLDEVRRLLEERGSLGVVYLDPGGAGQLETSHGWQAYDVVVRELAAAVRRLRADGLLGPRDLAATLGVRSDKFVLFASAQRAAGMEPAALDALSLELRSRLQRELALQLPAELALPVLLDCGHALLHREPMLRAERAVLRALDEAVLVSQRRRAQEEAERALGLDALIQGQQVVTLYQPIVRLADGHVVGHEVFTRGAPGSPFEDPEQLFALAERTGRVVEFERLCRQRALDSVHRHLRPGEKLFLNTAAHTLGDSEVAGAGFVRRIDAAGLPHGDVVLEITERVTLEPGRSPRAALAELKRRGFRIAIDDMGAGYASLQSIVELEPDFLKFDISLVRNIDRSVIKRSLLETLVDLSARLGAEVVAEGIEAESELATVREMGVELGQGHFLAPPQPVLPEGPPA